MLRLLQGDVGSGKTAVAAWALAARRWPAARAPCSRRRTCSPGSTRDARCDLLADLGVAVDAPHRVAAGAGAARRSRPSGPARRRSSSGPTRCSRSGRVRRPRPRGHRRAAPVRRRAARPARGEGRRPRAPRPADDRDADPAHAGPGPLRRPRRSDLRAAAGRSRSGPGSASPTSSRRRGRGPRGGGRRPPDVRRRAADRRGRGRRRTDDAGGADDDELLTSSAPAAEAEAERLRELLAPLRVGPRPRPAEGRATATPRWPASATASSTCSSARPWSRSASTSPEATMMVIEGAERFGLAQLHQLRGRVGRGTAESFCVLVSDAADGTARARGSRRSPTTRDGFELAERDFELRREGDVLGLAQSGLPRLRVASLQRETTASSRPRARDARRGAARRRRRSSGAAAGRARARARRRLARAGRGRRRAGRARRDGVADAGRVIAGRGAGRAARARRGTGTRPLGRPGQADAVRDPRARPRGRARPRPVRRQRRRRHRGAVARRGARPCFVERDAGAVPGDRREPRARRARRAAARVVRRDVVAWLRPGRRGRGRAVRPRPRRPAVRGHGRARCAALEPVAGRAPRAGCAPSSPSTSGGTRRPRGSGCWHPSASAGSARRR